MNSTNIEDAADLFDNSLPNRPHFLFGTETLNGSSKTIQELYFAKGFQVFKIREVHAKELDYHSLDAYPIGSIDLTKVNAIFNLDKEHESEADLEMSKTLYDEAEKYKKTIDDFFVYTIGFESDITGNKIYGVYSKYCYSAISEREAINILKDHCINLECKTEIDYEIDER